MPAMGAGPAWAASWPVATPAPARMHAHRASKALFTRLPLDDLVGSHTWWPDDSSPEPLFLPPLGPREYLSGLRSSRSSYRVKSSAPSSGRRSSTRAEPGSLRSWVRRLVTSHEKSLGNPD